jgi:branched-chain amino acid transport system ATP-binding protein
VSAALLEVRGLHAGYGTVEVLRGIDITVREGEAVALLGSNGAGKSTLNNVVCGLFPAWAGEVTFEGANLTSAHYRDVVKAGLIQVPEGRRIFPNLTVLENLELGAFTRARERRAENLEKSFALFPLLRERAGQVAGTLSGGEQQMLAIGRGLMADPRLLILDEPSLGLSPLLVEELFTLIRRLRDGGLAVLLLDLMKGAAGIVFVRWFYPWLYARPSVTPPSAPELHILLPWAVCVAGLAVVVGHGRSIWLNFTGGKSAAAGLGVLLAMSWPVALGAAAVVGLTLAIFRIMSLSSMLGALTAIVLVCALDQPIAYRLLVIAGGLYVIARHRANIRRLLAGTEPRLGQGSPG